jgi:DNA-binding response OmpR family regulator
MGVRDHDEGFHAGLPMNGKRLKVMIFEDDSLLASTLADVLARHGCEVGVITGSYDRAMEAACTQRCDVAVVDLHLGSVMAYPILDELQARGIPFVITTCLPRAEIPERYAAVPSVAKPYDIGELLHAIEQARVPGTPPLSAPGA